MTQNPKPGSLEALYGLMIKGVIAGVIVMVAGLWLGPNPYVIVFGAFISFGTAQFMIGLSVAESILACERKSNHNGKN